MDEHGQELRLSDVIAQAPAEILGTKIAEQFSELLFLFKALRAAQSLSIQVHPRKQAAEQGFAKENRSIFPWMCTTAQLLKTLTTNLS
ncbi:MAG: type I phosphomannose isomerase catalytic subunit [Candidatus Malihini olakiniferum]